MTNPRTASYGENYGFAPRLLEQRVHALMMGWAKRGEPNDYSEVVGLWSRIGDLWGKEAEYALSPRDREDAAMRADAAAAEVVHYKKMLSMKVGGEPNLRTKLIRLAHEKPEMRGHLLPLLKKADDLADGEEEAKKILARDLEPLKSGFWMPPHNLALNFALMGANLWEFTILPFMWEKRAYRADLGGIVLHPIWDSMDSGRTMGRMNMSGFSYLTPEIALRLVDMFHKAPLISHSVTRELRLIESRFGISIPSSMEANIVRDAVKVAKRRWRVDRLRVKDRLFPLDGSPPRDLGSFD